MVQMVKIGKRGTVTIPQEVRDRIGLREGDILVFEMHEKGILLRPAIATPVEPEVYTNLRKAQFLLSNAVDEEDYQAARRDVEAMGVNPDDVDHIRP